MQLSNWLTSVRNRLQNGPRRCQGRVQCAPSRTHSTIQYLEQRTLLTVQAFAIGTELFVVSDTGDSIAIRADFNLAPRVEVLGNGVPIPALTPTAAGTLTKITIAGDNGNNVIDLSGISTADFSASLEIIVDAGDGDDTITGSADIGATLNGNDGADQITGGTAADQINGNNGMDALSGGLGADTINGGDGADVVNGDKGNDVLNGNSGKDTINGNDGNDVVDAGAGIDSVLGGIGNDTLDGGSNGDEVFGEAGNDSLLGNTGNDLLDGGAGSDTLLGNAGRDSLFGQTDNDSLNGGGGADSLDAGDGQDTANGALGNDTVIGGNGDDILFGGGGRDLMYGDGETDATLVGNDRMAGNSGDDSMFGGLGADVINGNNGDDLIVTNDVSLSVADIAAPEGNAGETTSIMFTVVLSSEQPIPISVDYAITADGTLSGGTATPGVDFDTPLFTDTLTFLPGETTRNVPISVIGDDVFEADETFFITLSNSTTIGIADGIAEGRILEDDPEPPIDVVFALDDTGSFRLVLQSLQATFDGIVTSLQSSFPTIEFGFGVGRFEAFPTPPGTNDDANRPWVLNQPVISTNEPLFGLALPSALARNLPDDGTGRETIFDALFQIGTGLGLDADLNGDTLGDGPAGPLTTQIVFGPASGDIAAYNTFIPDPAGPVILPTFVSPATATDGVSFRPNARKFVIVATDASRVLHEDDLNPIYAGANGSMVPASTFAFGSTTLPFLNTPNGQGAGIQETIDALVSDGIQVITLGDIDSRAGLRQELEAISLLSGALNTTQNTIENFVDDTILDSDDIQPGDPLFFEVDVGNSTQLENAIVTAITAAIAPPDPTPPPPPSSAIGVDDTLSGNSGNDTIVSASGNDLINGGAGNDSLSGGSGMDTVVSGPGDDTLDGGSGDDDVTGEEGNNTLAGGNGDDTIVLEPFADSFNESVSTVGADTVIIRASANADTFTISQNADDLMVVTTATASIVISDSVSSVIVEGMDGDDTVTMDHIGRVRPLALSIRLGSGDDTFNGRNRNAGPFPIEILGEGGADTINGTAGGDRIVAGDDNDLVAGADGNDTIQGGFGVDTLNGESGDDSISGDEGSDSLIGDVGNDVLIGGLGNDFVNAMGGNDTLEGNEGNDTLFAGAGNDVLRGGVGSDSLKGHSGNDVISGGGGDDTIRGSIGDDTINGGDGDDLIEAGNGNDLVAGGDGDDFINAAGGNDTVLGGDSNDSLFGGGGRDIVLGGDGDDIVRGNGSSRDTIAGNEGDEDDLAGNLAGEINEAFTLAEALLAELDALE